MSAGWVFIGTALYLSLLVSFSLSLIEEGFGGTLWRTTVRRWAKFLLLLVVLGVILQILTVLAGR